MRCFYFALLFLCGCCEKGFDSLGNAKEGPVVLISADTGKRVLPSEMTAESQRLYHTLCEIRLPFFDAEDASFSNVLGFAEDTYSDFCNSSFGTSLILNLETPVYGSEKKHFAEMCVEKTAFCCLSDIEEEVLSSKVTMHLMDVSLMQILTAACAKAHEVIGIHNGSLVFSSLPEGSFEGKALKSLSWPVGRHPEAIIM